MAGMIVKTARGSFGQTDNKEPRVNGKVVVFVFEHELGASYKPGMKLRLKEGKPVKLLVAPEQLNVIGFWD